MAWLIIIGVWAVSLLCLVDAFRFPEADWIAADKNRGYWLVLIGTCYLVLPAPFVLVPYLLIIRPALEHADRDTSYDKK